MKSLILMGGEGSRFEAVTPKQFTPLAGKSIYLHTLDTFLKFSLFEEIVLVCHVLWMERVKKEVKDPRVRIVPGGSTRQNSTYRGLIACGKGTDFVMIHDAVRPFVSKEVIWRNIRALNKHAAVNTCIPSNDTIVYATSTKSITAIPNRSHCLLGQTPQSFSYPLILRAHEHAIHQMASDDCALVLELGHPVHIVPGCSKNIKITHQIDLLLAKQLIGLSSDACLNSAVSLAGKIYAITGGTGGIGSSLVTLLKEKKAKTVVLSTSSKYSVDLTDFKQASDVFKEIYHQYGPLDGLINCVGQLKIKPFCTLTVEEIDQLIHTNLHALLYSCRCARMKKKGHIVNLSSSAFAYGRKDYTIYSATKAAIVNFTQGLAEEHPELMINVIVPERTCTPMRCSNFPSEDPSTLLSPQTVAQKIVRVLQTDRITGAILEVRRRSI